MKLLSHFISLSCIISAAMVPSETLAAASPPTPEDLAVQLLAQKAAAASQVSDTSASSWLTEESAKPYLKSQSTFTPDDATVVTVTNDIVVPQTKRLGINMGFSDRFGAGQFRKNLLPNPGFEPGEYNTILHVLSNATGSRVQQAFWDARWNNDASNVGQPAGFWTNGSYEFVYGAAKGRSGKISNFKIEKCSASGGDDLRYTFYLNPSVPTPNQYDVMFARTSLPGISGNTSIADTATKRPGSPGKQSMRLAWPGAAWTSAWVIYLDSYGRDGDKGAGKLNVVKGNWRVEFWAKGKKDGDRIRARFFRTDGTNFVDKTFTLTTQWAKYTADEFVPDGKDPYPVSGTPPILAFSFYLGADGEEAWVDDAALYCTDYSNPTVFCDPLVDRMKELKPGVIRFWGCQLGDTFDNAIAEEFARKTHGFRPHSRQAILWDYSLHEFMQLCKEVGAEPWYVMPPTFTSADLQHFAEYLSAPAGQGHPYADKRAALGQHVPWTQVFKTVHIEYGNEMWGSASGSDPFWGASALGGIRLGQIASDRFAIMRSSAFFDAAHTNLIIGGQAGSPSTQYDINNNSTAHDSIALAPYFGVLNTFNSLEEVFCPLFARAQYDVDAGMVQQSDFYAKKAGKETRLSVYELNFHTTKGPAPTDLRNDYVTSQAGGVALPLYMLKYMKDFSMREICSFLTCGFSYRMENGDYVRIWGMLRDLLASKRKRPTWLGVELANKAIRGDMIATRQDGINPAWVQDAINDVKTPTNMDYIQSFAFRDGQGYGVLLFNVHLTDALPVKLQMPPDVRGRRVERFELFSPNIYDDNEEAQNVSIKTYKAGTAATESMDLNLPPHSMTALVYSPIDIGLLWEGQEVPAVDPLGLGTAISLLGLAALRLRTGH